MKFKKLRLRMLRRAVEALKSRAMSLWADLNRSDYSSDRALARGVWELSSEIDGIAEQVRLLVEEAGEKNEG